MSTEDNISVREIKCVKLGMDTAADNKTPASRAVHIANASGGAGNVDATINAILVVLENLGFVATS